MNFDTIILYQSMEKRQNYAIQILIALLFILKLKNFWKIFPSDVEKWFDTSNYDKSNKRPPPVGKNKKVPGLFKN